VSSGRKRPAGAGAEGASLISVRALVILAIAAVAGILVGHSTDLAVGISTGVGVAVALHAMVAP
jgi:L-aminopeptidase/D-esterase-like protein